MDDILFVVVEHLVLCPVEVIDMKNGQFLPHASTILEPGHDIAKSNFVLGYSRSWQTRLVSIYTGGLMEELRLCRLWDNTYVIIPSQSSWMLVRIPSLQQ
jgi:hypothetical protein